VVTAGCKSASPYISPRVDGRVLDADSHQPVPNVFVSRVNPNPQPKSDEPPKGGQLMERSRDGVRTSTTGTFSLDSVRDFEPFAHTGWYSVTLAFEHPGYQRKTATYTISDATNSATGEPMIQAGEIFLVPSR
jgi:hypothetical protein